jgi:hypothetical protein
MRLNRAVDSMGQHDRVDHFPTIDTTPPEKLKATRIISQVHESIRDHQTSTSRACHAHLLGLAITNPVHAFRSTRMLTDSSSGDHPPSVIDGLLDFGTRIAGEVADLLFPIFGGGSQSPSSPRAGSRRQQQTSSPSDNHPGHKQQSSHYWSTHSVVHNDHSFLRISGLFVSAPPIPYRWHAADV